MANLCSFPRAGNSEHRRSSSPYSVPGVHGELEEEQSPAQTAGGFPETTVQFLDNEGMSYSSENRQPGESSKLLPDREDCDSPQGPEAIRHNSSRIDGNSLRSVEGTPCTTMVQHFSSSSEKRPEEEAVCFTSLHESLNSLEKQEFPSQGSPIGQYSPQEISDHNRCITDRLGSCLGGQVSERKVGTPLVIRAHKCARTEGCSSSPITDYTLQTCTDNNGQYLCSLPHKSPRGDEIAKMPSGGNRSINMGMSTAVLTESNPHSGYSEQSSRHSVQDRASPRGVAATHDDSPNLGPIWNSPGRSFCISGNNPLPEMVLSQSTGGQFGPGCSVTRMADRLIVCFSPPSPNTSNSSEDQGRLLHDLASCSTLARKTMVCGDDSADSWSPVADTITGGSPVTIGWPNLASKPNGSTLVGMAPAEPVPQQLDDAVRETLNNARAPSTRANYAIKWRIFSEWCLGTDVDTITCSVPLVLRFLQFQLDQGKVASTIKVYASSISAFHGRVDGQAVGRHPLVCQFLKGVRRLCPNRTLRAPSWDLPLVLDSLTKPPYEPLANTDLKALSLKTAFLLAIYSAKRVG